MYPVIILSFAMAAAMIGISIYIIRLGYFRNWNNQEDDPLPPQAGDASARMETAGEESRPKSG